MQPFTIALVGSSHMHARMHLRTLNLCDEVESVILYDADSQTNDQLADEQGQKVAKKTTDLDSLLGRDDIPVFYMMLRNHEMPDACVAAAQAGKHLMCEKPVATNGADGLRVVRAAQDAGVTMSVCYPNVFNPVLRDIHRLASEGLLGGIWNFELRVITSQVRFRDPSLWLFDKAQAGGGILSWLGCHYLDMLRTVLDDEVASVMAMAKNSSGEAITVEDTACVLMETQNGAIGTLTGGFLLPASKAGYEGASYDTYLAIKGSLGNIKWMPFDRQAPSIEVESVHPDWQASPRRTLSYEMAQVEAYGGAFGLDFLKQFFRACFDGEQPPNTGFAALRVLEILDAVYQSAETGRRVEVRQQT